MPRLKSKENSRISIPVGTTVKIDIAIDKNRFIFHNIKTNKKDVVKWLIEQTIEYGRSKEVSLPNKVNIRSRVNIFLDRAEREGANDIFDLRNTCTLNKILNDLRVDDVSELIVDGIKQALLNPPPNINQDFDDGARRLPKASAGRLLKSRRHRSESWGVTGRKVEGNMGA